MVIPHQIRPLGETNPAVSAVMRNPAGLGTDALAVATFCVVDVTGAGEAAFVAGSAGAGADDSAAAGVGETAVGATDGGGADGVGEGEDGAEGDPVPTGAVGDSALTEAVAALSTGPVARLGVQPARTTQPARPVTTRRRVIMGIPSGRS